MRRLAIALALLAPLAWTASGQAPTLEDELRAEIARLKESLARAEALLTRAERERAPAASLPAGQVEAAAPPAETRPAEVALADAKPAPPPPRKPPALNTPPKLPASEDGFKKSPPRIDVLLQARHDYYADTSRNSTFFLRKAEVGLKGAIIKNVDFSLEVDLARTTANDPYRRTYIRLTHLKHLFFKVGQEKAPLGLEELTSSAQTPFVDRSEVSDRFSAAEEVGIFTESNFDHFMIQASLTNGGRRLYRDDNRKKNLTARAVWGPTPKFSLGVATMQGETGAQLADRVRYNVEAKYGANNLQGAQGEFYRAKDGSVWSSAFYVQGYWAKPVRKSWLTHVMPVARYEYIDRDDDNRNSELSQVTLGFGLLFGENRSKFQLNWLKDVRSDSPRKDELRAQFQVEF